MAKQIQIQVNHLKSIYEKLEGHQAELAATRTSRWLVPTSRLTALLQIKTLETSWNTCVARIME